MVDDVNITKEYEDPLKQSLILTSQQSSIELVTRPGMDPAPSGPGPHPPAPAAVFPWSLHPPPPTLPSPATSTRVSTGSAGALGAGSPEVATSPTTPAAAETPAGTTPPNMAVLAAVAYYPSFWSYRAAAALQAAQQQVLQIVSSKVL